jgi:hypothetical protein
LKIENKQPKVICSSFYSAWDLFYGLEVFIEPSQVFTSKVDPSDIKVGFAPAF